MGVGGILFGINVNVLKSFQLRWQRVLSFPFSSRHSGSVRDAASAMDYAERPSGPRRLPDRTPRAPAAVYSYAILGKVSGEILALHE